MANSLDLVDDKFENVDFSKERYYGTGALEIPYFDQIVGSVYEDAVPVMSEAEIQEAAERHEAEGGGEEYVLRIHNQRRDGQCVGDATTGAAEDTQVKQFGLSEAVPLSAASLYKQIGSSPSSGATVSSGLRTLHQIGALPLDTAENREQYGDHVFPNVGFHASYPSGWKDTASLFRCTEFHVVKTIQGLRTAVARQEPVVVGREGHSIRYVRELTDGRMVYPNSWSEGWGFAFGSHEGGFGVDTRRQIEKSARWAFVLRTVVGRS